MSGAGFEQALRIDAGHPALAGHFPDRPLVPGVILLEQVALALRAWRGLRLACVLEAKFSAPLLPAQAAVVRLAEADPGSPSGRFRFEIRHAGRVLARGLVEGTA
ncbi:MAG: hydroxymyristoyl-ACP dehydratase [Xanthomonadaceae bacterium]|jgi:3-hydroxymyristoyl/3-hydroxydecanoyl-(acyl carrier protein) dehydratase|nr:hydroxymyristoyl-ACP dehydratase [Xanthomonadaceae bacterium]MDE3071582.1 hydroxymyristoyl-ACP dehydratase [Pseudomonadota bacterium]